MKRRPRKVVRREPLLVSGDLIKGNNRAAYLYKTTNDDERLVGKRVDMNMIYMVVRSDSKKRLAYVYDPIDENVYAVDVELIRKVRK